MTIGGGEAADQMVRMMLSSGEVVVRLGGSALKNLLAFTMALVKNNQTISGKVNMTRMLQETRDLRLFPMSPEQYKQFQKHAKKQKILFSAIKDRDGKGKVIDVVMPVTELDRANLIFERIMYQGPTRQAPEQEERPDPSPERDRQERSPDRGRQDPQQAQEEPQELPPEQARPQPREGSPGTFPGPGPAGTPAGPGRPPGAPYRAVLPHAPGGAGRAQTDSRQVGFSTSPFPSARRSMGDPAKKRFSVGTRLARYQNQILYTQRLQEGRDDE